MRISMKVDILLFEEVIEELFLDCETLFSSLEHLNSPCEVGQCRKTPFEQVRNYRFKFVLWHNNSIHPSILYN